MGLFANALFKPMLVRQRRQLTDTTVRPVGYLCLCGERSSEHKAGTGKCSSWFCKCEKFERSVGVDFAFLKLG